MTNGSTTSPSRIEIIDVLRGFALAGILYAHVVIWYTGAALPPEVYFKYDSSANSFAMAVFGALVFGKFFSIFSFLFGLGFYFYFQKRRSNPGFLKVYLWRLFLLFLIGIIHHLFWRGDILAIYAILGALLIIFREIQPKFILIIALILIINLPNHLYELLWQQQATADVEFPMAERAQEYYNLVKNAGFQSNFWGNWNSWQAKINYQLESGRLLMTFGYFLLGLYAGRRNLFARINQHMPQFRVWNKFSKKAVLILLLIGFMMYLFGLVTLPEIKLEPGLKWPASFLYSIYNACLSIFYLTGITLLFRQKFFQSFLKPLGSMGRMALTNYLLQTFFGLILFYNFGLGLFDKTSPALNAAIAVFIFYFQLRFSQYWLRYYQQGPVEYLWKGMTYFNFSSNKKVK